MRPLFGVLATALLVLVSAVPALATSIRDRTITVGVYGNSIYSYQNPDGTWYGIDIELFTNIAQRKGLTMRFVDSVNDPDFLASLANGTYDAVTEVVKTPAREELYLFNSTALGNTSSAKLVVRADDDTWEYGDIEQVSRMRVGIVSSFAANENFREWCTSRALTPAIIEYPSVEALVAALDSGEIDGEVVSAVPSGAQVRRILELVPVDYYFAFRKDDSQLKNVVDEAMDEILLEDPFYLTNLTNKYATQTQTEQITLSKSEKAYIAEHGAVRVAVMSNNRPYYWRGADGSDHGIVPNYYATIAQKTGLTFTYQAYATYEEQVKAVQDGEADLVGVYANGIIAANEDGLALSQSFSSAPNVLLTLTGTNADDIKTVAINARSGSYISSLRRTEFDGINLVTYESAADCLDALNSGKVDATVVGTANAQWFMNETGYSRYSSSPLTWATMELAAAVRWNDTALGSILNKGISATKTGYDSIVTSNTLPDNDFVSFISRIPPLWLALTAALLLALAVGLAFALVMLHRRQRERAVVEAAKLENERREAHILAISKAAEEKNQFFSNISHDMRTPLNAVIGFSELAVGPSVSTAEKDEYFEKIQTSGNLLLDLINDTLTLSKLNNGKLALDPRPVPTQRICRSVVTPIREAAAQRAITFSLDESNYRPRTIMADELNLEKVILNLLSNAIKYTPRGGHVWLTVEDSPAGSSDPDLLFTVRDDGIGISEEFLPHLFEPFSQEGRGGETSGTGLGLSIVKNLVDMMGGTITVESKPNMGTTFSVRFHFDEVTGDVAAVAGDDASVANDAIAGTHVLICEDNEINAEVACELLGRMGVTCDVAQNGEEGLRHFEESPLGSYDAVLMDMRMPVMDGLAATRAIRALARADASSVPIIALTADAFEDDAQRSHAAGMNAHVSKPVDPDQLRSVLARLIEARTS